MKSNYFDKDLPKKQHPENIARPHDSILQSEDLIFNKNMNAFVNMSNYQQWWAW
jgi:hypothetical protein